VDAYTYSFLNGASIEVAPKIMGENLMVKGSREGGSSGPLLTP